MYGQKTGVASDSTYATVIAAIASIVMPPVIASLASAGLQKLANDVAHLEASFGGGVWMLGAAAVVFSCLLMTVVTLVTRSSRTWITGTVAILSSLASWTITWVAMPKTFWISFPVSVVVATSFVVAVLLSVAVRLFSARKYK